MTSLSNLHISIGHLAALSLDQIGAAAVVVFVLFAGLAYRRIHY